MSIETIVPIDDVKRVAKEAASLNKSLSDSCPWPYWSEAGRLFKQEFFFHKAALQALAGKATP